MSESEDGSLSVGERLERIEKALGGVSDRLRQVELRVVYVSATMAAIVSFGTIILTKLVG